jgi:hypothetical protein
MERGTQDVHAWLCWVVRTPVPLAVSLLAIGTACVPSAVPATMGTSAALAPVGASFINASHGYLMGDYACDGRPAGSAPCVALARTQDGGTSWQLLPAPKVDFFWGLSAEASSAPASVNAIDFANAEDGYLYGPGLEVTHNGGGSWSKVTLGQVAQLATAGGHAYALTTSSSPQGGETGAFWEAPLGSDAWSSLALPVAGASYELVSGGDEILLLQQDAHVAASNLGPSGRVWLRKTSSDGWRAVAVPCRPEHDGAAASLAISPNSPARWAVDCELDDQSSQAMDVQHRIFVTTNAGKTWSSAGVAPHQGIDSALAWNGSGNFMLATESAMDQLDSSADGGRQWRTSIRDGGDFYGWGNPSFVNTNTAFVVGPTHYGYGAHPDKLYRTVDGGELWSVVEMPRP